MLVQSKDVRVDLSAVDGGASESELDILGERTRGWQWQQRRKEVECLRILASLGLCRRGGGGGGVSAAAPESAPGKRTIGSFFLHAVESSTFFRF